MDQDGVFLARRGFVRKTVILCGFAYSLCSPSALFAQAAALKAIKLSDDTLFVQGPTSNVLVVDSDEGLILVDGGHADWFSSLETTVSEHFPDRPYRALINTHWHADQTGANLSLGKQGVEIIAHENTLLWQSTEIWQRWSGHTYSPLPKEALPVTTVYEDGSLEIANRTILYGYMRDSHTDGDIWVYIEDEDVLVTGGLVSNGRWPEIDWWTGGFIGGLMDGFVSLMSVPNANTKIIPSFGPLMTLDELKVQNQMYLTVFDRIHGSVIRSESLQELMAGKPTAEFDAVMGDPSQFLTLAFQSIQGHIRDPQNDRFLNFP